MFKKDASVCPSMEL